MKELMAYVEIIKTILDSDYGKEVVFYENGEWYSREHGRVITLDELKDYTLKTVFSYFPED